MILTEIQVTEKESHFFIYNLLLNICLCVISYALFKYWSCVTSCFWSRGQVKMYNLATLIIPECIIHEALSKTKLRKY